MSECSIPPKPPLGLVPAWVRKNERIEEIKEAIGRYFDDRRAIPIAWIEEYNELIKL